MLFFFFCPHSLPLTFLLALPPQYEGSRLNEEVSEVEEDKVLSALCVFPPPFVAMQTRRWASDDRRHPSVPGGHDL